MNQNLVIPLPTAQAIAALGIKMEAEHYWSDYGGDYIVLCSHRSDGSALNKKQWFAYTLGELPAVLEVIGKLKSWDDPKLIVHQQWNHTHLNRIDKLSHAQYHFLEICRLYAEEPKKGWEYLDNLLK